MRRRAFTSGGSRSYRKVGSIEVVGEGGTYTSRHQNAVRCPVCHGHARLLDSGYLRKHRDPFGHDCFNRKTP